MAHSQKSKACTNLGMLIITWQPEPKSMSCAATLESHFEPRWTHSFPGCSVLCIQPFISWVCEANRQSTLSIYCMLNSRQHAVNTCQIAYSWIFWSIFVFECVSVCFTAFVCAHSGLCVCLDICHCHTPPAGTVCRDKASWKHWPSGQSASSFGLQRILSAHIH